MLCSPCDSDRLNLPSVLVLNSCGITCAGDEKEIAAFCAHVSELDLSDNKLEDWHEVKFYSAVFWWNVAKIIVLFILLNILLNSTHLRFLFICFKINVSTLLVVIFQLTWLLLICFFINVKSTEELYSRHQKVDKTADIETASRALNFLLFH